jgi:hypothetical protein
MEQLRNSSLVDSSLLPTLFDILGISERGRAFDLAPYSVGEFDVDCEWRARRHCPPRNGVIMWLTSSILVFDDDTLSIPLLASYVYYRALKAVPSLVRFWWEGCMNRQLSMAVGVFTSRHFSPVLISQELDHLRKGGDDLSDENMTVKVSPAVNEVKAVYVVDEQPMEIGVRLPVDFPLQAVEVKDIRKVGVTDAQWRAWILNVQQVITTQVSHRPAVCVQTLIRS